MISSAEIIKYIKFIGMLNIIYLLYTPYIPIIVSGFKLLNNQFSTLNFYIFMFYVLIYTNGLFYTVCVLILSLILKNIDHVKKLFFLKFLLPRNILTCYTIYSVQISKLDYMLCNVQKYYAHFINKLINCLTIFLKIKFIEKLHAKYNNINLKFCNICMMYDDFTCNNIASYLMCNNFTDSSIIHPSNDAVKLMASRLVDINTFLNNDDDDDDYGNISDNDSINDDDDNNHENVTDNENSCEDLLIVSYILKNESIEFDNSEDIKRLSPSCFSDDIDKLNKLLMNLNRLQNNEIMSDFDMPYSEEISSDGETSDGETSDDDTLDLSDDANDIIGSDTDTDTDTNVDVDADTNTDTNTDTDTDTNVDTNVDASTNADTSTNVDASTDTNVDASTNANVDTSTNTNVDTSTNTNVDTITNTTVDTSTNTNVDASTNADNIIGTCINLIDTNNNESMDYEIHRNNEADEMQYDDGDDCLIFALRNKHLDDNITHIIDEKQTDNDVLAETIIKTIDKIPENGVKKILLKKKKKH